MSDVRIKALELAVQIFVALPDDRIGYADAVLKVAARFLDFLEPSAVPSEDAVQWRPDREIGDTKISSRVRQFCLNMNIKTVDQLSALFWYEALHTPNVGRKTFAEMKALLADYGLSFRTH